MRKPRGGSCLSPAMSCGSSLMFHKWRLRQDRLPCCITGIRCWAAPGLPEIDDRKQRTPLSQVHAVTQTPAACRSVLIVAGEPSADRYGARLDRRLNDCYDRGELRFFGTGGDDMRAAGA